MREFPEGYVEDLVLDTLEEFGLVATPEVMAAILRILDRVNEFEADDDDRAEEPDD